MYIEIVIIAIRVLFDLSLFKKGYIINMITKTCSLFGHRRMWLNDGIKEKLKNELTKQIENGFVRFLIGTHGDFDSLALSVLRSLKQKYQYLQIGLVFTSLYAFQKKYNGYSVADLYSDCEIFMYPIEEEYYKRQIIISNRYMINESDLVVCYVNPKTYQSGSKLAMKYAIKQNKKVINLFF